MNLVQKNKETRKSVPIFVQSFSGRGESRDLIYIFGAGQIDKTSCMCLTSLQPATANASKDRHTPSFLDLITGDSCVN